VDNFDYQQQAFDKLSKLKAGILFMSMGTGKTKVAVDLIISKQNDIDCIIWIAPASLIRSQSYKDEIRKWSNNLSKPIHFFTIESIGSSDNKFLKMISLASKQESFCVVDESITIKNAMAKRTQRLLRHWHLFKFRLILNGTPITNSLLDIYSQVQFIHPKILNMSERQFANQFLIYHKDGYRGYKKGNKPYNEEALIEILKPYICDAELEISCGLNFNNINCRLGEPEKCSYHFVKEDIYSKMDDEFDFLAIVQKLQHFYTENCLEKKFYFDDLVKQITKDNQVIVYVKYVSELDYLKANYNCVEYSGRCKDGIELFKNGAKILICTYGSGSMGHNLQFCNNIIYLSQTFDYKDKEQSLHRIYRVGQTKQCNVYNFYINTGLENIIKSSLDKKVNTLATIKNYITKENIMNL
jgi:SNF2 family DNA or RNA helicase